MRGKAGFREVERVLEAANLIVQKVETENDIGRDAYVDIVEGTDVTGGVVALQVKSGVTFFYRGQWVIPGSIADFTLWRESSVPMFGVVHDPATDQLRWTNLSTAAMSEFGPGGVDELEPRVINGPYGQRAVVVPNDNRLDIDIRSFILAANAALRQRVGLPADDLLSDDIKLVETAISDSFAIGRRNSRAFLLIAALLSRLPAEVQPLAVTVLAMATPHPDIFWTQDNWVPSEIKSEVAHASHWTNDDVSLLLGLVASDENGIQRGSFGQDVYHILVLDSQIDAKLRRAATDGRNDAAIRFWAAAILLYHAGEDAPQMLSQLLAEATDLQLDPLFNELAQVISEFGYVSMF